MVHIVILPLGHISCTSISLQARSRPYLSENDPPPSHHLAPGEQHRRRVFSQFSRQSREEGEGQARGRSVSFGGIVTRPPPPHATPPQEERNDFSERVVTFLRQPDIFEQLESRTGEVPSQALRYGWTWLGEWSVVVSYVQGSHRTDPAVRIASTGAAANTGGSHIPGSHHSTQVGVALSTHTSCLYFLFT